MIGPGTLKFMSEVIDGTRYALRTRDEETGCGGGNTSEEKEKIFHGLRNSETSGK